MQPRTSIADERRLKELQQAVNRFAEQSFSSAVGSPSAAAVAEAECASITWAEHHDLTSQNQWRGRSKRKAPVVPQPPPQRSMVPREEPPGIAAGGSKEPPGIAAGGSTVVFSIAQTCLQPTLPPYPPPARSLLGPPLGLSLPYFCQFAT